MKIVMKNNYKSLNHSLHFLNSVLAYRLLAGFVALAGVLLTISVILDAKEILLSILLPVAFSVVLYFLSLFSSVFYNSTDIVIQNIYGRKVFMKTEFLSITPLRSYMNIYTIKFTDGKSFLFSTGPLFIGYDAVKGAGKLSDDLIG